MRGLRLSEKVEKMDFPWELPRRTNQQNLTAQEDIPHAKARSIARWILCAFAPLREIGVQYVSNTVQTVVALCEKR